MATPNLHSKADKPFRFLDLPAELRCLVYELITPVNHALTFRYADQTNTVMLFSPTASSAILRTCRIVLKEAACLIDFTCQEFRWMPRSNSKVPMAPVPRLMADVACLAVLADTGGLLEALHKWVEHLRLDRKSNFKLFLRHHVTDEKHGWMLHWAVADWVQSAGRMLAQIDTTNWDFNRIYVVVPKPWDKTGIEVLQQRVSDLFEEMGCNLHMNFEPEDMPASSVTKRDKEAWVTRPSPFRFEGRGFWREGRARFLMGGLWRKVMELEMVGLDLTWPRRFGRLDEAWDGVEGGEL
jgi:hypothetical protein